MREGCIRDRSTYLGKTHVVDIRDAVRWTWRTVIRCGEPAGDTPAVGPQTLDGALHTSTTWGADEELLRPWLGAATIMGLRHVEFPYANERVGRGDVWRPSRRGPLGLLADAPAKGNEDGERC